LPFGGGCRPFEDEAVPPPTFLNKTKHVNNVTHFFIFWICCMIYDEMASCFMGLGVVLFRHFPSLFFFFGVFGSAMVVKITFDDYDYDDGREKIFRVDCWLSVMWL